MRKDFLLDENGDIIDEGFEWSEGDSIQQDVEEIVLLEKGELREFPTLGFGIARRIRSKIDVQKFVRELKVELESDGIKNAKIYVDEQLTEFRIELEEQK